MILCSETDSHIYALFISERRKYWARDQEKEALRKHVLLTAMRLQTRERGPKISMQQQKQRELRRCSNINSMAVSHIFLHALPPCGNKKMIPSTTDIYGLQTRAGNRCK